MLKKGDKLPRGFKKGKTYEDKSYGVISPKGKKSVFDPDTNSFRKPIKIKKTSRGK